jgi:hypothetical protein
MVGAAGIEPATLGLEIRCSIRLSYAPALCSVQFSKREAPKCCTSATHATSSWCIAATTSGRRGFDIRPSSSGHVCVSQNRLDSRGRQPRGLQIRSKSTPICVPAIPRQSRFLKYRTDHSLRKVGQIKCSAYRVRKQPRRSAIALGL